MKKLEYLECLYQRACRAARKSGMNHRHGAILIHNGEVVAEGYNYESPDFKDLFSVHAEMDVLAKVKHLGKAFLSQCEMMVVRIGPITLEHATKLSMPCPLCRPRIERAGIRKVYYTTNEEFDDAIKSHSRYNHISSRILEDRNAAMQRSLRYAAQQAQPAKPEKPVSDDDSGSDSSWNPRHGRARRTTDQQGFLTA